MTPVARLPAGIQTWWTSREALTALRSTGTPPAGILMFRAAGAEPTLSVFDVVGTVPATRRDPDTKKKSAAKKLRHKATLQQMLQEKDSGEDE